MSIHYREPLTDPEPAAVLCPACRANPHGLIGPDCALCLGIGTLELTGAAVANFPLPAVGVALEVLHGEEGAAGARRVAVAGRLVAP